MKAGDKVKAIGGPYTGFCGIIKEISSCGEYALVMNEDLFSMSIHISNLDINNGNERQKGTTEVESNSLKSSLETPGKLTTQIFHFSGGQKRTFTDLDLTKIKEGRLTKIRCTKGYRLCINPDNVDCFESHEQ